MQFVLLIHRICPSCGPDLKEVEVSNHSAVLFRFSRPRRTTSPHRWVYRLTLMWEAWRTRRILAELDARLARVAELRLFAELANAEIAAIVGVNTRTVERDWLKARTFLSACLVPDP